MNYELLLGNIANSALAIPGLFFLLAVVAVGFLGDGAFLFLTIFSINVNIPLYVVFIAAYIGKMCGDVTWFKLAKYIMPHVKKRKALYAGYLHVESFIEHLFKKDNIIALSIIKLLYGTRVITNIYLAHNKMKLRKFIETDLIASVFWLVVFGGLGILTGYGFKYIVEVVKNVLLAISLLIIFFIIFFFIQKRITIWLENRK